MGKMWVHRPHAGGPLHRGWGSELQNPGGGSLLIVKIPFIGNILHVRHFSFITAHSYSFLKDTPYMMFPFYRWETESWGAIYSSPEC